MTFVPFVILWGIDAITASIDGYARLCHVVLRRCGVSRGPRRPHLLEH